MATITKNDLLIKINNLRSAVENEDIDTLIPLIDNMGFDNRKLSMIMDYAQQLIINFISNYIKEKGLDKFRVERTETFDIYRICEGKLLRNGTNARFTSLGKLYCAYKYIKNK